MRARGGRGFLLPGLLFLFAIDLVPLVYSAWLSLYDWWLLRPRNIRFIGLGNYLQLATDPELRRAVVVTGLFTTGSVALEFMVGLFKKGYAQQANITGGGEPFTNGRMGVLVQAEPNDIPTVKRQAPNMRLAIGPTLKDKRQINFGTVGSYAIFDKSRNKEAALKWILHITTPQNMVQILRATGFISQRKSLQAGEYPVHQGDIWCGVSRTHRAVYRDAARRSQVAQQYSGHSEGHRQ